MLATLTTALRDLGLPGILGVLLGWGLNQISATRARRHQQTWEDEALLRKQQRDAVAATDEALADAAAELPSALDPAAFSAIAEAGRDFRRVWNRYEPRIYDEQLHERLDGAETLFRIADQQARTSDAPIADLAMAAELAVTNARQAIAAVLHNREFEPPCFPPAFWNTAPGASEDPVRYLAQWFDAHATESPVLIVRYMLLNPGQVPPGMDLPDDEPRD